MNRLETVAQRILSHTKSLYERVDGLHQLRAGRIRAVAQETLVLKGGDAWLEAKNAVKLQGEKIHLG